MTYSNVLITGSAGQMGQALAHHPSAKKHKLIFCDHQTLDIRNLSDIDHMLQLHATNVVINCAAYTAVDQAETEITSAMRVNAEGAKNISLACQKHRIPLIHLSTDYVFNGQQAAGYTENCKTQPLNVYGESKRQGEEHIRAILDQHIILRVSGIFSQYGNNFFKTMLRLGQTKTQLNVVDDQLTCPTDANDIADALFTLIEKNNYSGTYHYCSHETVSWYEFARNILEPLIQQGAEIKEKKILLEKIQPIPSSEYRTAAKRPRYSVLNCDRIRQDFSIQQPSWRVAVSRLLSEWRNLSP